MVLGLTATITRTTIGTAAVILVMAVVCGLITYILTSLIILSGMDRGGKFHGIIATLHIPLIIASAIAGGYLGYWLMST